MRNFLFKLLLGASTLATVTAIAATAAHSQSAPPPAGYEDRGPAKATLRADADGDGIMTRDEASAAAASRFARLDRNGDGVLSKDEMPPRRRPAPEGEQSAQITRDSFIAHALRRFDRMDANHDGRLDRTELANGREMRRGQHAEDGRAAPPPPREGH